MENVETIFDTGVRTNGRIWVEWNTKTGAVRVMPEGQWLNPEKEAGLSSEEKIYRQTKIDRLKAEASTQRSTR